MARTALLDTNVFVRRPQIVAYEVPDTEFATTPGVLAQLERLEDRPGSRRPFAALVSAALSAGKLKVLGIPTGTVLEPVMTGGRFDPIDTELLTVARSLSASHSVVLVTDDVALTRAASEVGIQVQAATQFLASIPSSSPTRADVTEKANTAARYTTRHLALSAIAGVAATLAAVLVYVNSQRIIRTANVWGTITLLVASGIALYWFRSRWRLAYGLFEYLIGVMGAGAVFWPNFDFAQLTATKWLQIIGGVYVMVRGLDNIGKGLEATRWSGVWRRVFR